MALFDLLKSAAEREGFPVAGAVDIAAAMSPDGGFKKHLDSYDSWLATGSAATMHYMERGRDRRADPTLVFPNAQSVFTVALPYSAAPTAARDARQSGPRYARYLRGEDYHSRISERLEAVMESSDKAWRASGSAGLQWKVCVDTSAVFERAWASLAGLGWIGKNTMLIHPQLGSYLLLGAVLIDQEVGFGPAPLPDYCGNCRRCLTACPTEAFTADRVLEPRRCISYWTLEARGDLGLEESDKSKIGPWIAGCDICQDVCPFNTKAQRQVADKNDARTADDSVLKTGWTELVDETEESYKARVRNSSLSRVKPAQFRRNLALTLANSAAELSKDLVSELEPRVAAKTESEPDIAARIEWRRCLERLKART